MNAKDTNFLSSITRSAKEQKNIKQKIKREKRQLKDPY